MWLANSAPNRWLRSWGRAMLMMNGAATTLCRQKAAPFSTAKAFSTGSAVEQAMPTMPTVAATQASDRLRRGPSRSYMYAAGKVASTMPMVFIDSTWPASASPKPTARTYRFCSVHRKAWPSSIRNAPARKRRAATSKDAMRCHQCMAGPQAFGAEVAAGAVGVGLPRIISTAVSVTAALPRASQTFHQSSSSDGR